MLQNPFKKLTRWEAALLVSIVVLLFVAWFFLVRNVQMARQAGIFQKNDTISRLLTKNRQANETMVKDIEFIDDWMTFQYVNFIFSLPDEYLKNRLIIDHPKYPRLPIGRYAKQKGLDKAKYLESIKNAVREYMDAHPSK